MNIIETPRLVLRDWEEEDLMPFASLNQDHKVLEFLPGALTVEESAAWINKLKEDCKEHGFGLWAATLKTGEFIGYIGLNVPAFKANFTPCIEIGWRLAPLYWGQGLAAEGARAALRYAFDELKLAEVVSFTVPENKRSIRVMEKIGMQRDLSGDFNHPKLPLDHPLSRHILYRIKNEKR